MAEKLEDYEFTRGRPEVYPWDEWLDGSPWRLTVGEDFTCNIPSMRAAVSRAAKNKKLTAHTAVEHGTDVDYLVIQAAPLPAPES